MTEIPSPQPAQAPAQVLQSCLRDFAAIAIEEGSELKPTAELVDALIKASTPESPIGRMRDALAAIPAPEGGPAPSHIAAMEQALEALTVCRLTLSDHDLDGSIAEMDCKAAITTLRAALAARPHPAGYTAALAARSATAIACLPDAPYKVALQKLHDDMLAAIAAQHQQAGPETADSVAKLLSRNDPTLGLKPQIEAQQAGRPAPAEAHGLTRDDLDLCRQWFNSAQDTNGGYLDRADYVLAERIYRALGLRVPSSITEPLGLPACDVQPKGTACAYPKCDGDEPAQGECCKRPAPTLPEYTSAVGEAAQAYIRSLCGPNWMHTNILPATFRWSDCWDVMCKAAAPSPAPGDALRSAVIALRDKARASFESSASSGYKLHDLYRMELDAILDAAPVQAPAVMDGALAKLLAHHAALLEHNSYAYFELAYTRSTGWMAWITDKPAKGEPGTPEYARSRKVIARGQGDTPEEAAADALAAMGESDVPVQGSEP